MPPYVVFGDAALRDMARRRPSTLEAFLEVRGVGERKRDDYGDAFVTAITDYCSDLGVPVDVAETGSESTPARRTRIDDAEGPRRAERRDDRLFRPLPPRRVDRRSDGIDGPRPLHGRRLSQRIPAL